MTAPKDGTVVEACPSPELLAPGTLPRPTWIRPEHWARMPWSAKWRATRSLLALGGVTMTPKLGQVVLVCDSRSKKTRDDRVWTVWSQSPTGWWLTRRTADGTVEWDDQPARCLKSTRPALERS